MLFYNTRKEDIHIENNCEPVTTNIVDKFVDSKELEPKGMSMIKEDFSLPV